MGISKEQFAKEVIEASEMEITIANMKKIIDVTFDVIKEELCEEGEFSMHKFGKWVVKTQKARNSRNPRTGAIIKVPEKLAVRFHAFDQLKDVINE